MIEKLPKRYPNNDYPERQAVNLVRQQVEKHRAIRTDLRTMDKMPHHDGNIEFLGDDERPVGRVTVQVRKIPDNMKSALCEVELIAYATKGISEPFFLLAVDVGNEIIYWRHITVDLAPDDESQASISIVFSNNDIVDTAGAFIAKWKDICGEYRRRIHEYPKLLSENDLLQKKTHEQSIPPEHVAAIQIFVSRVNQLLDSEYLAVKRRLFPDVWQIGFAFHSFSDGKVCYSLYAVPNGKIDLPAKYIPINDKTSSVVHGFQTVFGGDLLQEPGAAADNFVADHLDELINAHGLMGGCRALYVERFFQFMESYYFCLGLPLKSQYSVEEIRSGLCDYMFCWMHVAVGRFDALMQHQGQNYNGSVSAATLIEAVYNPDRDSFVREIELMRMSGRPILLSRINRVSIDTQSVGDLLNDFRETPDAYVSEPYPRPDYALTANRASYMIWEPYSAAKALQRTKGILMAFPTAYSIFLSANGFSPSNFLSSSLNSRIVCFYDHLQTNDVPCVEMVFLDADASTKHLPDVSVYDINKMKSMYRPDDGLNIWIDGCPYPVRSTTRYDAAFVFQKSPLEYLIYKFMGDDLRVRRNAGMMVPREAKKQISYSATRRNDVKAKLYEVHAELGKMFDGAIQVVADARNPARGYMAAHSLRELMGRLPEYVRGEKLESRRKNWAALFSCDPDDPVVGEWFQVQGDLMKCAHLKSPDVIPENPIQVASLLRKCEELLWKHLGSHTDVANELDRLLAVKLPTVDHIAYVRGFLSSSVRRRYFFQALKHVGWLQPLRDAGIFKAPPRDQNREGLTRNVYWPESGFLARMAGRDPSLVCDIILHDVPTLANPFIYLDFLDAAVAMPDRESVKLQKVLCNELIASFPFGASGKLIHLVSAWMRAGFHKEAKNLAWFTFDVVSGDESISSRRRTLIKMSAHEYNESLRQFIGLFGGASSIWLIKFLATLLHRALSYSDRTSPIDHSSIWRADISDDVAVSYGHQPEHLLISALRDTAVNFAKNCLVEDLRGLIEVFDKGEWHAFQRILLYAMAQAPERFVSSLASRILAVERYDTMHFRYEYLQLVKSGFSFLDASDQAAYLKLIEEGPSQ